MARVIAGAMALTAALCANATHSMPQDSVPADTATVTLNEIIVTSPDAGQAKRLRSSQNIEVMSQDKLLENLGGSLVQSLEKIPGITALNINPAQSKPVIRGLGFNRIIVAENGVKHEGQQWGVEHELEINQFAVDYAEIIKGPSALLYGSDAIGGVIDLNSSKVPEKKFGGNANLFTQSVNESLSLAAQIYGRPKPWFYYKANFTFLNYADTKVPADSIQYHSYWVKLKDRRLRNTAGREYDGNVLIGINNGWIHSTLLLSDVYNKSGFFADLHGLEVRMSGIDYDSSRRDIDLPYHQVNHAKVMSDTRLFLESATVDLSLAWQNNLRREYAEAVSHGYMPKPGNTLEREFAKNTYTAKLAAEWICGNVRINPGFNFEYQHNRRSGWGFIIPDFDVAGFGLYVTGTYSISRDFDLNAGVRFDRNMTHVSEYKDWFATPSPTGEPVYKTRSSDMKRNFNSMTWAAGLSWRLSNLQLKFNIGKGFRVPTPQELGADGINYHIFRYEKGNPQLEPETSYQADLGVSWDNGLLNFSIDPYFNYFPNYIYLNPTPQYTEGMQTYVYNQSRVIRFGAELTIGYTFQKDWKAWANFEYLYSRQLSGDKKGYSLPFSPPPTANIGLRYTPSLPISWLNDSYIELSCKMACSQRRIVPPERATDAYQTFGVALAKTFQFNTQSLTLNFKITNLLNSKYYNHMSYYRLSDIPEPGRNISLLLEWEF
mgnify:FL=1